MVCLWAARRALKSVEHIPVYLFFLLFCWVTVASYITFFERHFPSRGQVLVLGQLQSRSSGLGGSSIFLFVLEIILSMLGVPL